MIAGPRPSAVVWLSLGLLGALVPAPSSGTQAVPTMPIVDSVRVLAGLGSDTRDAFWAAHMGRMPVIESHPGNPDSLLVTFLYQGSGIERGVVLQSNAAAVLLPGDAQAVFEHVEGSDGWFLTMPAPSDLVTTYALRVTASDGDTTVLADPLNPDSVWTSNGTRVSALILPDAPPESWLSPREAPPDSWRVDTLIVAPTGEAGEVWSHLPPGYDASRPEPYPLVMALNRYNFRYAIPTGAVVDRMSERGEIPPVVLVVADALEPDAEGYESTAVWIADRLLPWIRQRYHVSLRPADVVLAGASRDGLVAAAVALLRPESIGNVVSLSGAFYWTPAPTSRPEWLTSLYADHPTVAVRYYAAVGTLETVVTETNSGLYPLATSRHFADILKARGYDYRLEEFAGTHDELNWRGWLGRGLRYLLGSPTGARP